MSTQNFTLVLDQVEIETTLHSIGAHGLSGDITGLMVSIQDGDYRDIFATESSAPYENDADYAMLMRDGILLDFDHQDFIELSKIEDTNTEAMPVL